MRFEPTRDLVDAVTAFVSGLRPGEAPCLVVPPEAFDDPRLLIACPRCGSPLKLNPFFLDVRPDIADLMNEGKAAYARGGLRIGMCLV